MKEPQYTNNQNTKPNQRQHHHTQGLTCDCKGCGVEFTQYHPQHVYCSSVCMWDHKGVDHQDHKCNDCGCVDDVAVHGKGYVCRICKMFRLNPNRTDVKRREPT